MSIEVPGSAVPAISASGLAIMLLFIIAVGGFVFSKVKRQVARS